MNDSFILKHCDLPSESPATCEFLKEVKSYGEKEILIPFCTNGEDICPFITHVEHEILEINNEFIRN